MPNFKYFSKLISGCLKYLLIAGLLTSMVLTILPASVVASAQMTHPYETRVFDCSTVTDVPIAECETLVALYDSTNGDGWDNNGNWFVSTTVGDWHGVGVTGGHVTELRLDNNQLTGSIPQAIENLSNIKELQFAFNELSGGIPAWLGSLTTLENLALGDNPLGGEIPSELGDLVNLTGLMLFNTGVTGSIPSELGELDNLIYMHLNDNNLDGSIPPELGDMDSIQGLHMNNNQLEGAIPEDLGDLSELWSLRIEDNQLTGSIPAHLGDLNNLELLNLTFNQLNGSIPQNLENLSNIKELKFDFNELSGGIPTWLGNLTTLENLGLGCNPLGGEIPTELGDLVNLTGLMLFHTGVTGSIPSELGKLDNVIHMHLNDNNLDGSIPPELGDMNSIQHLWMGNNQLEGAIPEDLGDLSGIHSLLLAKNQLSGDIPDSLTNLTELCPPDDDYCPGLDLGYNHLNTTGLSQTLLDFLAVNDPDWKSTQAIEETIPGGTGGSLTSNDGNTEITIPPDAVEGEVTFTFDPQPEPDHFTGNLVFASNSFELTAQDSTQNPVTIFAEPLTITLHYEEEDLAGGFEEDLALYYWDEGVNWWVDVVTTCDGGFYIRNLDEDWLSVTICHLSEFALLGKPVMNLYLPLITK